VLTGKVTVHTGSMTTHTGTGTDHVTAAQTSITRFGCAAPKKAAPKPDLMIKLEPKLITVRAVFAHLLSPEIIGNMLN
jgi:hypothetical protein